MAGGARTGVDLVDEAKKRLVLLLTCVFGLAYLMSLTSSSVWVNLPVAASLIFFLRYISVDLDIRRKISASEKLSSVDKISGKRAIEFPVVHIDDSSWRRKVNSPTVEAAIDQFTRHIVSEWVTDLWYSRITPDKNGPEELVGIINGVLGEISSRARDVNLIDLLIRDLINLFCNHLELYRASQSKIGARDFAKLPADVRDTQLKSVLAAENNLHPGLFSVEAEHKVLQHLVGGLISLTFKPEDLQCSFFRYTSRELIACAVMRPIVNLANPRIINEKIEAMVLSTANKSKSGSGVPSSAIGSAAINTKSPSQVAEIQDNYAPGVELVQMKRDDLAKTLDRSLEMKSNGNALQRGITKHEESDGIHHSGGEWGQALDAMTKRKTQALAPEHLENMWAKGRNYRKKESVHVPQQAAKEAPGCGSDALHKHANDSVQNRLANSDILRLQACDDLSVSEKLSSSNITDVPHHASVHSNTQTSLQQKPQEVDTDSSYQSEDDDDYHNVTGLDSPGTRVWDSKNKTKAANSRIRHPLECSEGKVSKKSKVHAFHPRIARVASGRRRNRPIIPREHAWNVSERSSFLAGDDHDILNASIGDKKLDESSDDSEVERWVRTYSGATISSSMSSLSTLESQSSSTYSSQTLAFDYSFLRLRSEVLGANIVKSGSVTFAVYSIAVTDADNNSWSIKRRFRHFEELHRRLKEFQEYNLSLPPKHFLSSGLDVSVVQERCKLLDIYLKKLLQLPTIAQSIDVWDFLSVDSQTYMFSDSLSVIQTLTVAQDPRSNGIAGKVQNKAQPISNHLDSAAESFGYTNQNNRSNSEGVSRRDLDQHLINSSKNENRPPEIASDPRRRNELHHGASGGTIKSPPGGIEEPLGTSESLSETVDGGSLPPEWISPNLSVPMLDLVDVVFQLHDGGWIRRQAFWVAKQVLQLGMGDAFDDWLIEKIQLLRKGSVIASVINRVEQILWPDGIFITKHPSRKRPMPQQSPKQGNSAGQNSTNDQLSYEEHLLASRRAQFVHELIIEKAPAALVGLVGRNEYERCARDIYLFLQSSVCLKQFTFELLELLLLSLFPELDANIRRCHEEKEYFGTPEDQ